MKPKLLFLFCMFFGTATAQAQISGLPSFADLIEKLSPSVVNISSTGKTKSEDKHTALGSGFILDKDGYILTNGHIVENAQDITVILHDNTPLSATIIGTDKKTDIALIKIDTIHPLTPATLGNSDNIRVGDWVLAIGNPFGLGGSVTAGIISAKSRDISSGPYDNYIQTDASINQGNSGGPMFNLNGEVIGINTALYSTTGSSMGIGFAIPINQTHFVTQQLKEFGKVNRSWIGLKINPQTENINGTRQGIAITGVTENSPAAKAGIEAGDIILSVNAKTISTPQIFSQTIAEIPNGQTIELEIMRHQDILKIKLITEALPETPSSQIISENNTNFNFPHLGIELKENTPDNNNADILAGLYIADVLATSNAAMNGIQKGNILIKIDGKDIVTLDNANDYINDAILDNRRPIELTVLDNNGSIRTIIINLSEAK